MIEKTPTEIKSLLENSNNKAIILDVREEWEYDICHIEGSILIPMGKITERIGELNKEDLTIVVCHHGIRSRMVGKYLLGLGFNNIINLTGGVDLWAKDVDTDMKTYV